MRKYLLVAVALVALSVPAGAETNSQQQRMKDCNAQATGMTGAARQVFMNGCLSGKSASTKQPHCVNGKPCGNTCIAISRGATRVNLRSPARLASVADRSL
jgi:hypothetical protein